jgi:copper(I)-binding protein
MQRLDSVEVPAGGKVEFAPGGLHLMLIGPKAPLAEGAAVPITLSFRSGAEIAVEAKVLAKPPAAAGAGDHGGMHHGHKTQ